MSRIEVKLHSSVTENNDRKNKGLVDIVRSLSKTEPGSHQIVVYPELGMLRKIYSNYIHEQLENNEIVLMLPFYETVDSVKKVLTNFRDKNNQKINVAEHLDKGSLLILDGFEAFFNHEWEIDERTESDANGESLANNNHGNIVSLMRIMQNQIKKLNKDGMTIILDMGCFFQNGGVEYILRYESSVPQIFKDSNLKQLCIYHQKDFETRFDKPKKAVLLDSHGRSVLMLDA
ncbi:MAG: hypothetical protein ACM3JQ_01110 [Candidatus Eiseniibacteriota bacterium]